MVEIVLQRDGLVVGGIEHGVDGEERRTVVGVARKTDENDQIVVVAVVQLAVGRPFDGLDMLQACLTTFLIGLFGNLHVGLEPHLSRVDTVDAIGRGNHLALAVVHGIAVIAAFAFHDGEAVGIVQVVVELVARGEAVDNLPVGLSDLHLDILQRSRPNAQQSSENDSEE